MKVKLMQKFPYKLVIVCMVKIILKFPQTELNATNIVDKLTFYLQIYSLHLFYLNYIKHITNMNQNLPPKNNVIFKKIN